MTVGHLSFVQRCFFNLLTLSTALFVGMPLASISYVWQVTGCQHVLLPTDDDFAAPSIPALTARGFSRWESLEILLGPDEHVPFLQYAVKNWDLRHPETGEPFPKTLPREVFPALVDADVDRWHESCAAELRREASKGEDVQHPRTVPRRPVFTHVRRPFTAETTRDKLVDPELAGRSFDYTHVPPRTPQPPPQPPSQPRGSARTPERIRRDSPAVERVRRKSFTDSRSWSPEVVHTDYSSPQSVPYTDHSAGRSPERRFPHTRHSPSNSSDGEQIEIRDKRRTRGTSPPASASASSRRFVPPSAPQPPSAINLPPFRTHRSDIRDEERKRRTGGTSPLGVIRNKVSETVSNMLPVGGKDRPRGDSRRASHNNAVSSGPRRSKEQMQPSRLTQSYSEFESDEESSLPSSEEELRRRQKMQAEERDRYRGKGRPRGSSRSESRDERDSNRRRDRQYAIRPQGVGGRTSSNQTDKTRARANSDRDRRDRERDGGRDRDKNRDDRPRRWDREREGQRERKSSEERGTSPGTAPMGSSSRRYAESAYS